MVYAGIVFADVESVEATGDMELTVTMSRPSVLRRATSLSSPPDRQPDRTGSGRRRFRAVSGRHRAVQIR